VAKDNTVNRRVSEFEARQRDKGLRKLWVWSYDEDRESIKDYAAKKKKAREKKAREKK